VDLRRARLIYVPLPGASLGALNSYEVYTPLSTLVYTSNQGNKFISPHHLPKPLADFLSKSANKR
jgi:hypothetical protein